MHGLIHLLHMNHFRPFFFPDSYVGVYVHSYASDVAYTPDPTEH